MNLIFKPTDEESFNVYKSWFVDEELNKRLGPMDDETWKKWQEYDEQEESIELVAFLDNEQVAVVDIGLPEEAHPEYCIAAIAIHPQKKRLGIGTNVLKYLLQESDFKKSKTWICHVALGNDKAIRFFEKNGWKFRVIENDMRTYEFIVKS